jgi:hypothetical protein
MSNLEDDDNKNQYFDASSFKEDMSDGERMDVSEGSTDEDQEFLDSFNAIASTTRQTAHLLLQEMSNDDEDDSKEGFGGSRPGRAKNKSRDFVGAYDRLV